MLKGQCVVPIVSSTNDCEKRRNIPKSFLTFLCFFIGFAVVEVCNISLQDCRTVIVHWVLLLGILFVGYVYALKKKAFDWRS